MRLSALVLSFCLLCVSFADARPVPESFADLTAQLAPAVVNISTLTKPEANPARQPNPFEGHPLFEEFFGGNFMFELPQQRRPSSSLGSGVIISRDGYIVTNHHVVAEADDIVVKMNGAQTEYSATVVGADPKNDIALLKIEASELPAVKLGDSDAIRVGDWVMAIGNPFGLGGSVTAGIISGRGRNIDQGPYDDFLQTDAAVNPGNSGGPLFNMNGDVVGINTAIFTRSGGYQGISFAIPSNTVALVVDQLREHGRPIRGWLGVRIQHVTKELAEVLELAQRQGALVAGVVAGSPAERAGLKEGDVITAFDGNPVVEMKDLPKMVAETPVGKEVRVTVLRAGERKRLRVTIEELDEGTETNRVVTDGDESSDTAIAGMILSVLDDAARETLGVDKSTEGVVIERVLPNSRAHISGLRAGDILVQVNKQNVTIPEGVHAILADRTAENTLLLIIRNGDNSFMALKGEQD